MTHFGKLLDESDPARWFWLCQAAKRGNMYHFLGNFSRQVQEFESGSGNVVNMFQIGKALNGHVSVEKRTIFGDDDDFDNLIGPANTAISFNKSQLAACRLAIDTWSLCCLRLNIYKDLRVLIGKMVWESRGLALFDLERTKWTMPLLHRI
jgi:hypothetical protein